MLKKILLFSLFLCFSGGVFSQKTIAEHVDDLGNRYVKNRKNHGLVVGIIYGDETSVKAFGEMSKTDKTVPDVNSIFEIGAVTSVFTTTLMQLQADKNKFQPHDPVHLYLDIETNIPAYHPLKCVNVDLVPNINDGQRVGGQREIYRCFEDPMGKPECITFCDLATHISGLPHSPKGWFKWKPIGRNKLGNDFKDFAVDKYFTRLQSLKLEYVPGTKYIHSDFGIALLGNAMSKISGLSYEQLLTQELLEPLGMKNTKLTFSDRTDLNIVPGHNRKGKQVEPWDFDAMAPAAGLKTSMNDLLVFVNANLNPPNKKIENAFAEVQQSKVDVMFGKGVRATSMGYGWYTSTLTEESNLPVVWINGGTGGFRSFIGFIKDTNTAVVILSNSSKGVDEMGFKILEILNAQKKVIVNK
ncbi:MAG: serine hydrolase domain-containing protein [Saprospiraceae bacterium]